MDKLILKGVFDVSSANFLKVSIQEKVDTLSRRGKGETDDTESEGDVASNLKGTLRDVPIEERRDGILPTFFNGTAQMKAKLSEMTTGFKSFLLRAVDPFFKKNKSGAVIPIKITGTRRQPAFGLDLP